MANLTEPVVDYGPNEPWSDDLSTVQTDRLSRQAETFNEREYAPSGKRKIVAANPEGQAILDRNQPPSKTPRSNKTIVAASPEAEDVLTRSRLSAQASEFRTDEALPNDVQQLPQEPKQPGLIEAGLHTAVEGISQVTDPVYKSGARLVGSLHEKSRDNVFTPEEQAKHNEHVEEALRLGVGIFGPYVPEPGHSEGTLNTGLSAVGMLPIIGGLARGGRFGMKLLEKSGLVDRGAELLKRLPDVLPKADELAQAGHKIKSSLESLTPAERQSAVGMFPAGKPGVTVEKAPLPKVHGDFSPEELAAREPLIAIVSRADDGTPNGTLVFNTDHSMVQMVTLPNTGLKVLRSLWEEGKAQGLTIADITKQSFTPSGAKLTDVLMTRYQRSGFGEDVTGRGILDKLKVFQETSVAPAFLPDELVRMDKAYPGSMEVAGILGEAGMFAPGDILKVVSAIYSNPAVRSTIGGVAGGAYSISSAEGNPDAYDLITSVISGAVGGAAARVILNSATAIPSILNLLRKRNIRDEIMLNPQMTVLVGNTPIKVNTKAFDTPEAVNVALSEIKTTFREQGLAPNLTTHPNYEPARATLAEKLGLSVDEVTTLLSKAADPIAETLAWERLFTSHWDDFIVPLTKQAVAGSKLATDAYVGAWVHHVNMVRQFVGKAGVTQQEFFKVYGGKYLRQGSARIGGDVAANEQQMLIKMSNMASELAEIANRMDPSVLHKSVAMAVKNDDIPVGEVLKGYMYYNLLSSPTTHFNNVVSGGFVTPLIETMERLTADVLPAFLAFKGRDMSELNRMGVVAGEEFVMGAAYGDTILNMMRIIDGAGMGGSKLVDVMKGLGQVQAKIGDVPAVGNGMGPLAAFVDHVVATMTLGTRHIPGNLLSFEDALMTALNYNMAVRAYGLRTAKSEGLTGAERALRIDKIVADPPPNIIQAAKEEASKRVFTNEVPDWVKGLSTDNADNLVTKAIIPFIKVPYNIAAYTFQRIPGIQILSKPFRDDMMAGGARAQLAQAKLINGSAYAYIGYQLAIDGRVTGEGPQSPSLRAVWLQSHQPHSIRVGDNWYSYDRLDPIASFLGGMADHAFAVSQLSDEEAQNNSLTDYALMYTYAFASNMESKNWTKAAGEMFALIRRADAENPETTNQRLARYGDNKIGFVFPGSALIRTVNRAMFDNTQYQVNTSGDKWTARTPWGNSSMKPKLTYFGDELVYDTFGPGLVSPIAKQGVKDNYVVGEIVGTKASMPHIPTVVDGTRLTGEQTYWLTKEFSNTLPNHDGPTLYEELEEMIDSDLYRDLENDEQRGVALHELAAAHMERAMEAMTDEKYTKLWPDNPFLKPNETQRQQRIGGLTSQRQPPTNQKQQHFAQLKQRQRSGEQVGAIDFSIG